MATMNISLPKQMKEWVEQRSASGQFANASDYVRDLIREDQQRREATAELQALIDVGLASGVSEKSLGEVVAEAKRKGREALKARDAA